MLLENTTSLLDIIRLFEISEGAGGLLDLGSTLPLICIQVLILVWVLTLRLFLPIVRLEAVRDFYNRYLESVINDIKGRLDQISGLKQYSYAVQLSVIEDTRGSSGTYYPVTFASQTTRKIARHATRLTKLKELL
jgi:hypothetical protein